MEPTMDNPRDLHANPISKRRLKNLLWKARQIDGQHRMTLLARDVEQIVELALWALSLGDKEV